MQPDAISTPIVKARTTRHLWLWGSLVFAVVAWLLFWWIASHRSILFLPDGTVIRYAGVHQGKPLNDTEFENDIYAYSQELISPPPLKERVNEFIEGMTHPRRRKPVSCDEYLSAPELLLLHVSEVSPSKHDLRFVLGDGLGYEQTLNFGRSESNPIRLNYMSLPRRSPTWTVKVRDQYHQVLGELILPNPSFKPEPLFSGKSPPLESRKAKGVLKLLMASYDDQKEDESFLGSRVTLTFDASACPDLLPCQVIGVRVTDSWGNTCFVRGSLEADGKTIRAVWYRSPLSGYAPMQSEDWHIKIAICRGYGASFNADEMGIFDHIYVQSGKQSPVVRTIAGRQLSLQPVFSIESRDPTKWRLSRLVWDLDQKGPALWPILVKATGHTSSGEVVEINSMPSKSPHESSKYWVIRERRRPGGGNGKIVSAPSFDAGFMSPPELNDFDLHVALEEPLVFEFHARIANWPEGSAMTEDRRE